MQRKIIHIDMDSFFASVEVRENPALRGKPVAVGGAVQSRGVVATCSYEARKYGVHSAMPISRALKKCPQLVLLPVRMDLYKQVSRDIRNIFLRYTNTIEPLSLDEAYLDVTDSLHCRGSATLIAKHIREDIFHTQQLTASAGIAPNKFLAKVASDWNKPNGQKVIAPDQVHAFVHDLPVNRISGVGKVTARRMAELELKTCGDLYKLGQKKLLDYFGKFGHSLYHYSQGIDPRPVQTHHIRKSLSVEDTFPADLPDMAGCLQQLPGLYQELLRRLDRASQQQRLVTKSLFVKVRFNDFVTTTVQHQAIRPDLNSYLELCKLAWQRGKRPVRLLGLGAQFNPPDRPIQLSLFADEQENAFRSP